MRFANHQLNQKVDIIHQLPYPLRSFWIKTKTYSMESPQGFLDTSTFLGNPLAGLTVILKSQRNEKYHLGIMSHLCELS